MSVLDQRYRRWHGTPTGFVRRILVIPKYDLLEIMGRRGWLLAWLACLVPPFVLAAGAYLAVNIGRLRTFIPFLPANLQLPLPGPEVYHGFLIVQCWLLAAFAILVGPPLATRDFANGAMPLYLSKALRRWDYVAGRCAVLAGLLSLASWIPYLAVFAMQLGLATPAWRAENWGLALDIIAGTLPTVLLLTVLIVATGAIVQRTNITRAALLFLLLGAQPLAEILEASIDSPSVKVASPTDVSARLREWAFEDAEAAAALTPIDRRRSRDAGGMSPGLALLALVGWVGGGLLVIGRRVRPVEVVR